MGFDVQMEHDDRYDLADEYLQVVYALWEGGWADDAVMRDRSRGIYTDPRRVHLVRHHGKQFRVDAVLLWEPSPQHTPVLYGGRLRSWPRIRRPPRRVRVRQLQHQTECPRASGGV